MSSVSKETKNSTPAPSKHFTHQRYNELLGELFDEARHLAVVKGGEYAGDDDRLANFRRNADALGILPATVWGVYAAKHWDAVMQYIRDEAIGNKRPRAEPLLSRVIDLIVYLTLFAAILEETDADNATRRDDGHDPSVAGTTPRAASPSGYIDR